MKAGLHRRAVLGMDHPAADQPLHAVGRQVLARQHGDHAGHGQGRRGIDRADAGMGVRAAHEHRMALARLGEVVCVMAAAGDEAEIFLAADRLSDQRGTHREAMRGMKGTYAWTASICTRWVPAATSTVARMSHGKLNRLLQCSGPCTLSLPLRMLKSGVIDF